jgi:hypothetical protein
MTDDRLCAADLLLLFGFLFLSRSWKSKVTVSGMSNVYCLPERRPRSCMYCTHVHIQAFIHGFGYLSLCTPARQCIVLCRT